LKWVQILNMNEADLNRRLAGLPLGPLRYFKTIGSTNEAAARWAENGAPDLSLVVADEQTAGRGRSGRRWHTPPGAALAVSIVLRSTFHVSRFTEYVPRLTALGALAVCTALREIYGLPAEIKWPNDVLVGRRKLAGILVEAIWQGDRMEAAVLGIGVNVSPAALPAAVELRFPATSVQTAAGKRIDRWDLLHAILEALLFWRPRLAAAEFLQAWEAQLAFRGEPVRVFTDQGISLEGEIAGLDEGGALQLRSASGEISTIQVGEVHLRPIDRPGK
jgi:BirA family biotin operon repressor/biotin-[acetyl-CoA-carboxylase] ligase